MTTAAHFPTSSRKLMRGQRQLCEQLLGPVPLGLSEGPCASLGKEMVNQAVLPWACNICPPSLRFQKRLGNLHPSLPPASLQPARAGKILVLAACQGQGARWATFHPLGGGQPRQLWKTGSLVKKLLGFYKVVTTVGLHVIKPKCHFSSLNSRVR